MNTYKLSFFGGWAEISYYQTIQLPDVVAPATDDTPETTTPGGTQSVTLQCTSYHPTQLELIHADCATHGVTIEGDDAQAVAEWVADYVPPPPPVPTLADFEEALTQHLDTTAQKRQYDNRITCMVRAGFAGPFQAEGIAFAAWCDTCNAFAYTFMVDVQAGKQPMPASPAAFIKQLPPMVWPS